MTGELPMQFGDFGEAYLATVSDAVSSYRMRVEEQQQVLQQLQLQRAQQFLNRRPDLAPGHSSNRTSAEEADADRQAPRAQDLVQTSDAAAAAAAGPAAAALPVGTDAITASDAGVSERVGGGFGTAATPVNAPASSSELEAVAASPAAQIDDAGEFRLHISVGPTALGAAASDAPTALGAAASDAPTALGAAASDAPGAGVSAAQLVTPSPSSDMPAAQDSTASGSGEDQIVSSVEIERSAHEVHELVTCDGCGLSPIRGPRWKCNQCPGCEWGVRREFGGVFLGGSLKLTCICGLPCSFMWPRTRTDMYLRSPMPRTHWRPLTCICGLQCPEPQTRTLLHMYLWSPMLFYVAPNPDSDALSCGSNSLLCGPEPGLCFRLRSVRRLSLPIQVCGWLPPYTCATHCQYVGFAYTCATHCQYIGFADGANTRVHTSTRTHAQNLIIARTC
jgi:hypothetical protein